jgi:hypothetical protein
MAAALLGTLLLSFSTGWTQVWYDLYENGKEACEAGRWQEAEKNLLAAIAAEQKPKARHITNTNQTIEYLPYYWLAQSCLFSIRADDAVAVAASKAEKALDNLDKSIDLYGAIRLTSHLRHAEALRSIAERLIETGRQAARHRSQSDVQKLLDTFRTERDSLAAQLAELQRRQARPALRAFLIERYLEASKAFRAASVLYPEMELANQFLEKTNTELRRLNIPQPVDTVSVTKYLTQISKPEIFLRTPENAEDLRLRKKELRIAGHVFDAGGLDRLEFTVNGLPLLNPDSSQRILGTADLSDSTRVSFDERLPLRLGENSIVLYAYDKDAPPNLETRRLYPVRLPPFYQTPLFAVVAASLVIVPLLAVVITRRVKYHIAIVNKFNPYIAGAPVRDAEMFFGREPIIQRILNTLHNNSLMLYGPRRIGKTSLQHQLKRRLESLDDPDYWFVPVMIDLQGIDEEQFFPALMEETLDACKLHLPDDVPVRIRQKNEPYSARDFSHDIKLVIEQLGAQTEKVLKLVLLIDEVDQLNKYSEQVNQKLRSIFMKTYAENLVAVMSGAYIRKSWESEGSPWYNFFEELEVPVLPKADAEALISRPVSGIFSYDQEAMDRIMSHSAGKPYIIQRICFNVINRIIELKRRHITAMDVDVVWEKMSTLSNISNMM